MREEEREYERDGEVKMLQSELYACAVLFIGGLVRTSSIQLAVAYHLAESQSLASYTTR